MERTEEYRGQGKLDAVVVYGISSKVLVQAPGGREHARMVPKAYFRDFSLEDEDGAYYLRKDAILGVFVVDSSQKPPEFNMVALQELSGEERRDAQISQDLERATKQLRTNAQRVASGLFRSATISGAAQALSPDYYGAEAEPFRETAQTHHGGIRGGGELEMGHIKVIQERESPGV